LGADFIDTRFAVYDGIPIPKMMTSANVYVGVGFNLGKAKYMPCMQPKTKLQIRMAEKKQQRKNRSAAAAEVQSAI
jgi:hypothetical protein